MKIFKLLLASFLITNTVLAQTFTPTDAGSKIHFVIKNFGIKTGGDFTGLKGSIIFNPTTLGTSQFTVSVKSSTIDTDNGARDNHLRKAEYFDVEKYPLISFVSTKIAQSTVAGRFVMFGNLTIKGVTKAIQFGFTAVPSANGYLFNGEFEINRRDYGVGGSSVSMADNLKISLSVAANK